MLDVLGLLMKLNKVHSHYQKESTMLIDDKTIEIPANHYYGCWKRKISDTN